MSEAARTRVLRYGVVSEDERDQRFEVDPGEPAREWFFGAVAEALQDINRWRGAAAEEAEPRWFSLGFGPQRLVRLRASAPLSNRTSRPMALFELHLPVPEPWLTGWPPAPRLRRAPRWVVAEDLLDAQARLEAEGSSFLLLSAPMTPGDPLRVAPTAVRDLAVWARSAPPGDALGWEVLGPAGEPRAAHLPPETPARPAPGRPPPPPPTVRPAPPALPDPPPPDAAPPPPPASAPSHPGEARAVDTPWHLPGPTATSPQPPSWPGPLLVLGGWFVVIGMMFVGVLGFEAYRRVAHPPAPVTAPPSASGVETAREHFGALWAEVWEAVEGPPSAPTLPTPPPGEAEPAGPLDAAS